MAIFKKYISIILILAALQSFGQNYNESKAGEYQLPELLSTENGQSVSSPEQ